MMNFNKKFNCIVVGNSPTLVGSNLGDIIDSYETIIRVNLCNVPNLYKDTGKKTHIWAASLYSRAQEKFKMSKQEADSFIPPTIINKEIWYRHPTSRDYVKDYLQDDSFKYRAITRKPDNGVTGIMAISTAIEIYKNVDIVGHTLYVESKGNTQTYSHSSHHEQGLIDRRGDSVRLLSSYREEGKLNLLNPKEESILFSNVVYV